MVNPAYWARKHDPALSCKTATIIIGDEDAKFTFFINASTITSGSQSYTAAGGTIANGGRAFCHPKCLTLTMNLVGAGAGTRGAKYRITGANQFGDTVTEDVDFGNQAGTGTTTADSSYYRMYTRNAFRYITSVEKVAVNSSGNLGVSDNFSLGVTLQTVNQGGSTTTTSVLTNITTALGGSNSANQRMAMALPIPVSSGTGASGASSTGFESEICGMGSSLALSGPLDRGTGWFVDVPYSTFIPQSTPNQLPGPGPLSGGFYLYVIQVQTNRGE